MLLLHVQSKTMMVVQRSAERFQLGVYHCAIAVCAEQDYGDSLKICRTLSAESVSLCYCCIEQDYGGSLKICRTLSAERVPLCYSAVCADTTMAFV